MMEKKMKELEKKISAMEQQNSSLESKVSSLQEEVHGLKKELDLKVNKSVLKQTVDSITGCIFTPGK